MHMSSVKSRVERSHVSSTVDGWLTGTKGLASAERAISCEDSATFAKMLRTIAKVLSWAPCTGV
eukprot:scaffold3296_cov405-Prasinococcus_capsulatus_cf.AAC.6